MKLPWSTVSPTCPDPHVWVEGTFHRRPILDAGEGMVTRQVGFVYECKHCEHKEWIIPREKTPPNPYELMCP